MERIKALQLAPLLQSGAGRVITNLAIDLRGHDIKSDVVSSGDTAALRDWPEYADLLRRAGVHYREINLFQRDHQTLWNSVGRLAEVLRGEKYQILHAHAGVPALAAAFALDLAHSDAALLATFHGWGLDRPAWMDDMDVAAFSRCDRLIVQSTYHRDFFVAKGVRRERVVIIPSGIDPALLNMTKDRRALDKACGGKIGGRPAIVVVAPIERRKNQEAAIDALGRLPRNLLPVMVLIGGTLEPDYEKSIRGMVNRLGLSEQVFFLGHVDDPFPMLAAADVFLSTSRSEALGLAVLEAMALGVPVIASAVEGAADLVIDGRTALAVDPGNPERIGVAIMKAINDGELRDHLRRGARSLVEEHYLWPTTVERIASLYRNIQ